MLDSPHPRTCIASNLIAIVLGSVDICSTAPTWQGLSEPSRSSLDTVDKPRFREFKKMKCQQTLDLHVKIFDASSLAAQEHPSINCATSVVIKELE